MRRTHRFAGLLAMCAAAAIAVAPVGADDVDRRWLDTRVVRADRDALDRLVGYAPPEFGPGAQWVAGEPLAWEDLHGKVVVVQMWSRRHAASVALPERLSRQLGAHERDGLEVVLVHTQEGADGAEAFLERRPTPVHHVIDHNADFGQAVGVQRALTNLVIGRDGRVRYVGLSPQGVAAATELLLGEGYDPKAEAPAKAPAVAQTPGAGFPPVEGEVTHANDIRGGQAPSLDSINWMSERPAQRAPVTMVEFYATWCAPCNAMIPKLNKFAQQFAGRVDFLVVSREDENTVRNAAQSGQFKVPVGHDVGSRLSAAVGVRGVPHAFIMCSQGVVRWQGNPHALTNAIFEQIIAADEAQRSRG